MLYIYLQAFYLKLENLSCFKLFLLLVTLWTTHLGTHTHTYTHARVTETAVDLVPNRKEKKMKEKAARGAAWRSCCCCCCWGCSWLLVQGARFDTSDLMWRQIYIYRCLLLLLCLLLHGFWFGSLRFFSLSPCVCVFGLLYKPFAFYWLWVCWHHSWGLCGRRLRLRRRLRLCY